ncbi:hypothetical protein [Filimonas effusa]|uniref:Outer membrane protein beta-barrel domain-containing protein n=1 Tax=Filimonas effusa TaxID=2508721 RepID=A0A4Q1CZK4_9BACT|nr:hypothetical protein [Filimonas effusa]RXK80823.1 hypothetical protein ESB13_21955 [Filimonas effusa]
MRMIFFTLLSVFIANNLLAQHKVSLYINAGLAVPVGQLASTNQVGGGMSVLAAKSLNNHLSIVAEPSIMSMVGTQQHGIKYVSRQLFSFTAGARYYMNLLPGKVLWYSQLKAGIHTDKGYAGPSFEGGLGCLMYPTTTRLDLSLRYQENLQKKELYHTRFFSLKVGYLLRFKHIRRQKA